MTIQTDADGTIYQGNLLVSLGWEYIRFLFQRKQYLLVLDRLFCLPFFYFLSHLPFCMRMAFVPFRGCPVELAEKIKKPVSIKWLKVVEKINPKKIIIISRQEKNLLQIFIKNSLELRKFNNIEIFSNTAEINNGKFTGKFAISIRQYHKQGYIDNDLVYLGDLRDFVLWGCKKKNFILI